MTLRVLGLVAFLLALCIIVYAALHPAETTPVGPAGGTTRDAWSSAVPADASTGAAAAAAAPETPASRRAELYRDAAVQVGRPEGGAAYRRSCEDRGAPVLIDDGDSVSVTAVTEGELDAVAGAFRPVHDGPYLVTIGAEWCMPCCKELGELEDLARRINPRNPRLVFVFEDPTKDPRNLLWKRDKVIESHRAQNGLARRRAFERFVEFRSDTSGGWKRLVQTAIRDWKRGHLPEVRFPVNLLMDGCGHVVAIVDGEVGAHVEELARLAEGHRRCEPCRCRPDCGGKECGPDGCGGQCGRCGRGEECRDGHCVSNRPVCRPACPSYKVCVMDRGRPVCRSKR